MAVKEYFSESKQELIREIGKHHPDVKLKLIQYNNSQWSEAVGEIAAHCNVLLDGMYTSEDMEGLYPVLVHKLRDMRTIRIVQ